jgi:molecular chaperone DnaK
MTTKTIGIGIDLGTSNSAISVVNIGEGHAVFSEARDLAGHREIPSVVYFPLGGAPIYGSPAVSHSLSLPDNLRVLSNIKLLLRENHGIELSGLEDLVEPRIIVRGLLAYLKACFERTFNLPCNRVVITAPAYEDFDVDYVAQIREAVMGDDPLFESFITISEPDAVLLSLGSLERFSGKKLLVFDMGGGTLDIAIREVEFVGDKPFLPQLAVMGSSTAGRKLTFSDEERRSLIQYNFQAIDETKRILSGLANRPGIDPETSHRTNLLSDNPNSRQYRPEISVERFREFALRIIQEAIETVKAALAKAGLLENEIDCYFVVGGSSMLPLLDDELEKFFGKKAEPLIGSYGVIDKTLAIARGAAVYDLDRSEDDGEHSGNAVPSTIPVLERKLPYSISMVVDNRTATKALVPEGSVLPFGPERFKVFAPSEGRSIDIVLVRGEGHPDQCVELQPATISFIDAPKVDETVHIEVKVSGAGELMVSAYDHKIRDLGVIRIDQI